MKKNDCFLMQGSSINDPMTIYYITDMKKDKIRALSICIKDDMVQGLKCDSEYDNDIPKEAIPLPTLAYQNVRTTMLSFLKDIKSFIKENLIEGDFTIDVGCHYYDGYIHTITEIGEKRLKYKLFRLEEENISPCWSGDDLIDSFKNHCLPISDKTYDEVVQKYECFVAQLRHELYKDK
jgi:hypothetical protein